MAAATLKTCCFAVFWIFFKWHSSLPLQDMVLVEIGNFFVPPELHEKVEALGSNFSAIVPVLCEFLRLFS